MICVKDENQSQLFSTPFEQELDFSNRWVKFSKIIPWNKISGYYTKRMCQTNGASSLSARIVVGAIIIKHHEDLSDEGTLEAIQENIYMQYFLGLPSFKKEALFTPSLLVEIRKRLGLDYWADINQIIIEHNTPKPEEKEKEPPKNKGTINIDATIIEQDIQYPTDLNLLNESREMLDKLITIVCIKTGAARPRTYRIKARKHYLNVAKKKKKTGKEIRKAVGRQLNYVQRNLKQLNILLNDYLDVGWIFTKQELKYNQVINELYRQQREMHTTQTHRIADRIVSIHQPHVRPMVRGKAGADVEFGSKIGLCIHNGLTYLDHLSWDSYNETEDLTTSVENYKIRNGYYPEKINADQIYITRLNQSWCKTRDIKLNGKPLTKAKEMDKDQVKELRQSVRERNCVEGKIGQGKRWYGLSNIRAKLNTTSESMIGAIFVVLNLVRLVQQHVYTFIKIVTDKIINTIMNLVYLKFKVELFE
jgi:transposase, IS5 family